MEASLMKKAVFTLVALFFFCAGAAQAGNPDACLGEWWTADKGAKITVLKCDRFYCGKLSWIKDDPEALDTKNPDPAKRTNKVLGSIMIWDMKYNSSKDRWDGGKIYDANNGSTYSAWMKLDGQNKLQLRGYVGISLLGRTETWTRVEK
jgi:uncharacterized protein (DUF2147 family)